MILEYLEPKDENFEKVKLIIDNTKQELYLDNKLLVNEFPASCIFLGENQIKELVKILKQNGY